MAHLTVLDADVPKDLEKMSTLIRFFFSLMYISLFLPIFFSIGGACIFLQKLTKGLCIHVAYHSRLVVMW